MLARAAAVKIYIGGPGVYRVERGDITRASGLDGEALDSAERRSMHDA